MRATFDMLDAARQEALTDDFKELMARFNTATGGAITVPAEYLQVIVHTN